MEIKNYGHEDQKTKLIAGIVLTGGGSQLKHLKQLVEYITGMDTRVGYPNEHMAGDSDSEVTSPMYATAVGLVLNGLENTKVDETKDLSGETGPQDSEGETGPENPGGESDIEIEKEKKKGFFDKWVENLKDFLDKAE